MNLYDLAVLLFVGLLALSGLRLGLVRGVLRLVGFVLAVFLALRLEALLGSWVAGLLHTAPWATQLAVFAAILGATGVCVRLGADRLARLLPRTGGVRLIDRLGGATLGVLVALLPVWLVTGLLLLVPASTAALARAAQTSSTAKIMSAWSPSWPQGVLAYVGKVAVGPDKGQAVYRLQRLLSSNDSLQPLAAQEAQMLALLNQTRLQFGLQPLTLDPTLQNAARAHSADMVANDYFEHVSPRFGTPMDRMQAAGERATYYGENIALALDANQAEIAFMHSPGHRANILDPHYTRVGIGAVKDGLMVMFTQDFAGD
jgi:uncharacterized protein YkwD